MSKQYLAEGLKGAFPFIVDKEKIVTETLGAGKSRTRFPGRFSVCDSVNGNNRRYRKQVWEKNLKPGSTLRTLIERNAAFGLLEHPSDGQITLQSPICLLITEAKMVETKDAAGKSISEIHGEIMVLGTQEGNKLSALIEGGYNPMVSSRGFGSLTRTNDGIDEVEEDYVCEGWDVVIKPSFENAEIAIPREEPEIAVAETKVEYLKQTNLVIDSKPTKNLKVESRETQPSSVEPAPEPTGKKIESSPVKSMNLTEIKSQIAQFRATPVARLSPSAFAEGMAQLTQLHNEVASFLSEDQKRSWQATQLHEEVKTIEQAWTNVQLAPQRKVGQLNDSNAKLMRVIKAVAETGLTLKQKLGESIKAQNRQTKLIEAVVTRGEGWQDLASKRKARLEKLEHRYELACEALDLLAAKYKADTTELGKRVIQLEFKESAQVPEIQKLLKEATKPKHIVAIREQLEGKVSAPAPKGAEGKPTPPVAEGKATPKAPVSEGITVLSQAPSDPRGLNESIAMVKRMSGASAIK